MVCIRTNLCKKYNYTFIDKDVIIMSATSIKFSVSFLPETIRLYQCSVNQYENVSRMLRLDDIMCQTIVQDEVTLYYYVKDTTVNGNLHTILAKWMVCDPRIYHIINIHEDHPGLDHIGIISYLSSLFSSNHIPILYVNTYSYNLIFVAEEWLEKTKSILEKIIY